MNNKFRSIDFQIEFSHLTGKEVSLLSKSNARYQGTLYKIDQNDIWLKNCVHRKK